MNNIKKSRIALTWVLLVFCFISVSDAYISYSETYSNGNFTSLSLGSCGVTAPFCRYSFDSGYIAARNGGGSPVIVNVPGSLRFLGNGTGDLTAYPVYSKTLNPIPFDSGFNINFDFRILGNCYNRAVQMKLYFYNQTNGQYLSYLGLPFLKSTTGGTTCISDNLNTDAGTCTFYNATSVSVSQIQNNNHYILTKQAMKDAGCAYAGDDTNLLLYNYTIEDLSASGNGGSMWELDNLSITNQPNQMPTIDRFSYNVSQCFTENNSINNPVVLLLNVSASDPENNTLYYSLETVNKNTRNDVIDFQEDACGLGNLVCVAIPNYDFLNSVYSHGGTNCEINTSEVPENADDNIVVYDNDYEAWVLRLNPILCSGEKRFEYIINESTQYLYYSPFFTSFIPGAEINVTFHDKQSYQDQSNIYKIKNTLTNRLLVYDNYTLLLNVSSLTMSPKYQLQFSITENFNGTSTIHLFGNVNGTATVNTSDAGGLRKVIELDYQGWNVDLMRFAISSYKIVPNFTTTKPGSYSVGSDNLRILSLYVTDSAHLATGGYTKRDLVVDLMQCKFATTIDSTNPINVFGDMTKNSVKSYLMAIGLYDLGGKVIWIFFLFIFFGLLIAEYYAIRRLDITFALFASSGICLLMSAAGEYLVNIISFGLLLAFSAAAPLAQHYLSAGGGSRN